MGLSTFIEINNDYTGDIVKDPNRFMRGLLEYLNSGSLVQNNIPAIVNMTTLHRDDKQYKEIKKAMRMKNHDR